MIRPLLEYANGAATLVSIKSLLLETGRETLALRRDKQKLQLFYKMYNELTPDYLSSLVPPHIGDTITYQLRNAESLQIVQANSQLYFNSFLPSVLRSWNDIPTESRKQTSLRAFRCQMYI